MDISVGLDSAWTDNPKAPGAIAAVGNENGRVCAWHAPRPVTFDQASALVREARSVDGVTLIALDQPTLVPNPTGC